MSKWRREPRYDDETARALAYMQVRDESNIVYIDADGNAQPTRGISLDEAVDILQLSTLNTHPMSYNPPKGRWRK